MPVDYVAPDPTVAEYVYRSQVESDRQHLRLSAAPSELLKAVARDQNEPVSARANALFFLLMRRDSEMPGMLLELFEDPNQKLWTMVVRSYRPNDERIRDRLRQFLDDPHEQSWSAAAVALARYQDQTIAPQLESWLREGDRPRRNVAIECLKLLDVLGGRLLLSDFWDRNLGDEEDRLVVAAALLTLDDPRGLSLLESTAQAAKGIWSVFAATSIYSHDSRHGLELMLGILHEGDLESRQALVNQIWNFTDLPHAFTADGIHEARAWIESELASQLISRDAKALRPRAVVYSPILVFLSRSIWSDPNAPPHPFTHPCCTDGFATHRGSGTNALRATDHLGAGQAADRRGSG